MEANLLSGELTLEKRLLTYRGRGCLPIGAEADLLAALIYMEANLLSGELSTAPVWAGHGKPGT
jgi:hypothetical protein